MAKLHEHAKKRKVTHRRYWDAEGLLGKNAKFGSLHHVEGANAAQLRIIEAARKENFAYLKKFERAHPERQSLIHSDLHYGNFLIRQDGIGAIDFDDSGFGFQAYDLAAPLTHAEKLLEKKPRKEFLACADALQNGYASIRRWDAHDQAVLPYLFVARRLTMLSWLQSRSDNPQIKGYIPKTIIAVTKMLKKDWRRFQ
jgi:Ser/Thr protein kinase RdoA (MazF antagonist)